MDLSEELISVLQRAKEEGTYFNPWILVGVLNAIQEGDPDYDKKISEDIDKWANNMFSR